MAILEKKKYEKLFLCWIISLIVLLAIMIVVGGLTRLTNSGLSITRWDLIKGIIPPLNLNEWEYYFSLYKQIPQYKLINFDITLSEFKVIYFWEYIHRLLGRIIGLTFLIPLIFFSLNKVFTKEYNYNFIFLFLIILFQGFIGWYMVKSGLINNVSVSHFRLSLHLFIAFTIYSSLCWYTLNYLSTSNKKFFINSSSFLPLKFFIFFIFLQIIMGAFVSGLDAGSIYQTWPLMNENYFPNDLIGKNYIYFLNLNDQSLVQFYHRNLAYLIFLIYVYIGFILFKKQRKDLYKTYFYLFVLILIQILLGILTLLSNLSIFLASLHQISSIFLIFFSLQLYHQSIKVLDS